MQDDLSTRSQGRTMATASAALEKRRLASQSMLDAERTQIERNIAGQFATPASLAADITSFTMQRLEDDRVTFLEPSCGTGAFFSALLEHLDERVLDQATGIEIDTRFAQTASELWSGAGLNVLTDDFANWSLSTNLQVNLLLANPPYVRHHHLDPKMKVTLGQEIERSLGIRVSGLAGLYVYFMLLAHRLLAPGAVSAWLVPSEFLDVNYGRALRQYLSQYVTPLRIHRFDPADTQFADALVTSSVIVFQNNKPPDDTTVEFTFGGSLSAPRETKNIRLNQMDADRKWSAHHRSETRSVVDSGVTLGDLFEVRRGIATGANAFFIRPLSEFESLGISRQFIRPILPGPRALRTNIVESDGEGWPILHKVLAVIDTNASLDEIRDDDAPLADYLVTAGENVTKGYLVQRRTPWYRQERRQPAPFLLTYMGRAREDKPPLRFILNRSEAIGTNMFLFLYPKGPLKRYLKSSPAADRVVLDALLSLSPDTLRNGGRVYGGGLQKIEPREFKQLPADELLAHLSEVKIEFSGPHQMHLMI